MARSPKASSPKARSLKARSPKARSPQARSPKARSPKSRSPKARSPKARRTEGQKVRYLHYKKSEKNGVANATPATPLTSSLYRGKEKIATRGGYIAAELLGPTKY